MFCILKKKKISAINLALLQIILSSFFINSQANDQINSQAKWHWSENSKVKLAHI